MILSNTVATSVILNGATSTVNTPADIVAPAGFSVVSNGENWQGRPGQNAVISALGTPASSATVTCDCSLANCFTVTASNSFTLALSNVLPGQVVLFVVTAGSGTITWPGTVTWFSGGSGGAAPSFATLKGIVVLICTGVGTYAGWLESQITS